LDETQSLEDKLNGIEETFRDPNLLIQSTKEMQQNLEESLRDIQSGGTPLFGSIKLSEYSNTNPFKSEILDEQQCLELIKLCEFSPNDKWSLLYRGTTYQTP
jgi:hypothetical protein